MLNSFGSKIDKRRFPYSVEIERHPLHKGDFGDPRKSWCYECVQGPWAAEDGLFTGKRIYHFTNEQDSLMFFLRWDGEEA